MKNKLGLLLCIVVMVLAGCVQRNLGASTEPEITRTQLAETQPTEIEALDETTYIGELTPEGMLFTATDAAGNPISGVITVEDQIATVTFTDSTWELLENGSAFHYRKSADIPHVWSE